MCKLDVGCRSQTPYNANQVEDDSDVSCAKECSLDVKSCFQIMLERGNVV